MAEHACRLIYQRGRFGHRCHLYLTVDMAERIFVAGRVINLRRGAVSI